MQVAVFGAGAVGSLIAARLHDRGVSPTVVGRSNHIEAIRERGLEIRSRSGVRTVQLTAKTALDGRTDIVLLTVKSQDVRDACRDIARVAPGATIVTLQNGVRADEEAAEVVGRDVVVGCVVYIAATYLEAGIVEQVSPALLQVGVPFPEARQRADPVVEVLSKAMRVEWVSDLAASRWTKLMGNLSNAIPAATGLSVAEIFRHPALTRLAIAAMREGVQTARAAGHPLDQSARARTFRLMALLPAPLSFAIFARILARQFRVGGSFGGSTLQSVLRRTSSELEYLNGEIVRAGQAVGRPTPINRTLLERGLAVFKTRQFMTPEALLAGLPI